MEDGKPLSLVLGEVMHLISDPNAWIKNNFAMTKTGRATFVTSKHAVKFCLLGAIRRVEERNDVISLRPGLLKEVIENQIHKTFPQRSLGGHIPSFNDNNATTHGDVMKVLENAIHAAQRKEEGIMKAAQTRRRKAKRK